MKTKIIFVSALCVIMLFSGCLVKSLHPFYTEDDLLVRPELAGNWVSADSSDGKMRPTWEIRQHMEFQGLFKDKKPGKGYDITFTDQKGKSTFYAHLFSLDNQLYLDFYLPDVEGQDLAVMHLIPAHTLARVDLSKDRITIRWYNEEWLVKLFNENRVRIAHERIPYDIDEKNPDNFQVVLTAPTADLRKFILKYGNDPDAFKADKNNSDYTFVLKRRT